MEEETRRYRPTKNYLEYLPAPSYNAFEVIFMIYGITSKMIDVWLLEIANIMLSDLFLDWNNEKWIWKDASTITNGNVEHEEVSIVSLWKVTLMKFTSCQFSWCHMEDLTCVLEISRKGK